MPKGSGGGGNGGRTGGDGGGSSAPPEVQEALKVYSQIDTVKSEIAKTNRAYDVATNAGDRTQRKMLRELRRNLESKQSELEKKVNNPSMRMRTEIVNGQRISYIGKTKI